MSMNLDLELGKSEDRVRAWKAERVEVIRVLGEASGHHLRVGAPLGSVEGPGSRQPIEPLHHLSREAPPLGWLDQSSSSSSPVVVKRTGLNPQDKRRAWRRHTVVV